MPTHSVGASFCLLYSALTTPAAAEAALGCTAQRRCIILSLWLPPPAPCFSSPLLQPLQLKMFLDPFINTTHVPDFLAVFLSLCTHNALAYSTNFAYCHRSCR
ncbi:hypothetical protein C8J55DRAFT_517593 [Lentinula edodes]|uniref:Secreted protein n=1 Tax=Lentinula lateritia TaxID=40482 RepID=A0A9W9DLD4_9AGAR|nr:hypothetical protein C8J55DRAFT_517593 [Lentinula edodes]